MPITRREFVKGGVAAFTVSFAAPEFLSDLAVAQGQSRRNLVVLYLSGGNDALSTLIPYNDPQYYARRTALAIPAANVLKIGSDTSGRALGLNPRLTGLQTIYNAGRLAIIQRTGYPNSSRSHFQGTDIWSTADPSSPQGLGWLGRYLDTLPSPVDPLTAWSTVRETPRTLLARTVGVPSIPNAAQYAFNSPNPGTPDAQLGRDSAARIASHVPVDRPYLAFVNATAQAAFATLDRVADVATYRPTILYPKTTALRRHCRPWRVRWSAGSGRVCSGSRSAASTRTRGRTPISRTVVQHADERVELGAVRFLHRPAEPGAAQRHAAAAVLRVRPPDQRERQRRDRPWAAGLMFAMGGAVRGGLYGTAADLRAAPDNPTLENNGNDVRHETDFRSVYATVIDRWLGADSTVVLGQNFRGGPGFLS